MAAARTGTELHGIQMLRALAAVAVVTHHTLEMSNGAAGRFSPDWLTTSGASGVDIFFVISGFIMLHVSFRPNRPPPSPGSFLFRRATRIYPFYWLCCLAILLAAYAGFMRGQRWGALNVFTSLTLLPGDNTLINVAWTLVYELYFYLIFAVMLLFRSRRVAVVGSTLSIIGFWLAADLAPIPIVQSYLADPIPLEFCMGLWLAWAFSRWESSFRGFSLALVLGAAGIAVMAAAPLFIQHADTAELPGFPRVLGWGIPAVLVMLAALPIGPPRTWLARCAVLVGDASYALYLTHVFVMIAYGWLLKSTGIGTASQIPIVAIVVAVAIVTAVLAHLLVEQPLLAMVRRVTGRHPALVGPAIMPHSPP